MTAPLGSQAVTADDEQVLQRAVLLVCRAFVAGAPIDGAAFTQMTSDTARDPWVASDAVIAGIESAQYNLGEGPTQDAYASRRPVMVPDLGAAWVATRWPMFIARITSLDVGGLFALPMQIGAITVGVCAVYRRRSGSLSEDELRVVLSAMDDATLTLLALRAGRLDSSVEIAQPGETLPRGVHQATGMLVVQLGVSAESAFARLRAHAYATGRTIHEVAEDIVERRLRLEADLP
jgi:hypothetical protein